MTRGGGRAAAAGPARERLPSVRSALSLWPEVPLPGAGLGALGPEAVVSPQAEMDLEAARNGTARRPGTVEGDFELGSIRYTGPQSHRLCLYT